MLCNMPHLVVCYYSFNAQLAVDYPLFLVVSCQKSVFTAILIVVIAYCVCMFLSVFLFFMQTLTL